MHAIRNSWLMRSLWKRTILTSLIGMSLAGGAHPVRAQQDQPLRPLTTAFQQPTEPAPTNAADEAKIEQTPAADAPKPDEPWTLVSLFDDQCGKNILKDNSITIAGFSQWGYQSGPDGAFTGNGPFLNQREWDHFNLNQQYLYAEKIADGSKDKWDWGFRADVFYGVDGNEGQSFGNPPGHWDYQNGFDHGMYEWALPQLYGELAYGKFSVKLGHFYTPIGYEVVPSTGQFFLSRQITFYNSEPFTHTGALSTYKATDKLTLNFGYFLGWDTGFSQLRGGSMVNLGATWAITDKTNFIYQLGAGNFGWRGDGAINSFILSQQWTEKFSTVHQFDVLDTNNGTTFQVDGVPGNSTGLINYGFYEITKKVKAGVRYEWYKADGTSYNTLTYGVNYMPHPNVRIRPEMRHLWSPGAENFGGAPGSIAQNIQNVYGHSNVFGIDIIFTY